MLRISSIYRLTGTANFLNNVATRTPILIYPDFPSTYTRLSLLKKGGTGLALINFLRGIRNVDDYKMNLCIDLSPATSHFARHFIFVYHILIRLLLLSAASIFLYKSNVDQL